MYVAACYNNMVSFCVRCGLLQQHGLVLCTLRPVTTTWSRFVYVAACYNNMVSFCVRCGLLQQHGLGLCTLRPVTTHGLGLCTFRATRLVGKYQVNDIQVQVKSRDISLNSMSQVIKTRVSPCDSSQPMRLESIHATRVSPCDSSQPMRLESAHATRVNPCDSSQPMRLESTNVYISMRNMNTYLTLFLQTISRQKSIEKSNIKYT